MSGFLQGNDVDSPPVDGFEKSELKTRESKYTFEPVCLKEIDEMSSFAEADMKYSKSTKMEIHSLKQIAAQEFILFAMDNREEAKKQIHQTFPKKHDLNFIFIDSSK